MTMEFDRLSTDELRILIEKLWEDVGVLKNQCFFILDGLEDMFVLGTASREGGYVSLQVAEERTHALQWISGEALDGARRLESRIDALFERAQP